MQSNRDRITFTRLVADRAWPEADRRLARIVEEELEASIGELIGVHFLEGAKRSTAVLANAIGTGIDSVPLESPHDASIELRVPYEPGDVRSARGS